MRLELPTVAALAALAALAGCGPAQPPESLRQLEALAGAADVEDAAKAAATAWGESQRYLALAGGALEDGDAAAADRLAELGLIQGKLAMTSLREQRTRERLEAAAEVEALRKLEIERLESAVAGMEQLLARDRMRRHVEAVVGAGRRRAAAAEERAAGARQGGAKLEAARLEVGREMVGRARVEAAVLGALAAAGAALREQGSSADGAIALAEQALEREDLAVVQECVEEIGADTHRAFAWAFEGAGTAPAERISDLAKIIVAAGFAAVPDDYGVAASLEGGRRGKRTGCDDRLAALREALKDAPRHSVVSIDARGAHPFAALEEGKGRCPAALVVPLPSPP